MIPHTIAALADALERHFGLDRETAVAKAHEIAREMEAHDGVELRDKPDA